jgi:hypothetical protein
LNSPKEGKNSSLSFAVWGQQHHWNKYVSDEFYEVFHVEMVQRLQWKTYKRGMQVDVLLFVEQ